MENPLKALFLSFAVALVCAPMLLGADSETSTNDRVAIQLRAGLGGHYCASYERKLSDSFGLEMGAIYGGKFIRLDLSQLHRGGPFVGGNFYFTTIPQPHYLYLAPSVAVTFGNASFRTQEDWNRYYAIGLSGTLFLAYRYLFSFGLGLEGGIGTDVVDILFPLKRNEAINAFALPIPNIALGISYAF